MFSSISTYDFVAHLDRQVHSVTCSFIPGLQRADTTGESGCFAVMMSPYSSVFRDLTWGGIPIALPSLSVFAFLVFLGIDLILRKAAYKPKEAVFAVLACALPVIVSAFYFVVSVKLVGSLCKSCVGIYVASAGGLAAAILGYLSARRSRDPETAQPMPWVRHALSFVQGVAFVAVPLALFLFLKPAYTEDLARCGGLIQPDDKYGVKIKLGEGVGADQVPALVLLDPLCPACKAFHDRLNASEHVKDLALEAVVFPLDTECNWMLSKSLHPGACAVSEALLCSGGNAREVLDWAFENQKELMDSAAGGSEPVYQKITSRFPALKDCLKKPLVKSRMNKSLRWIVSNAAEVMVPQLFIDGVRLCSEDSDLGLDYALARAVSNAKSAPHRGRAGK